MSDLASLLHGPNKLDAVDSVIPQPTIQDAIIPAAAAVPGINPGINSGAFTGNLGDSQFTISDLGIPTADASSSTSIPIQSLLNTDPNTAPPVIDNSEYLATNTDTRTIAIKRSRSDAGLDAPANTGSPKLPTPALTSPNASRDRKNSEHSTVHLPGVVIDTDAKMESLLKENFSASVVSIRIALKTIEYCQKSRPIDSFRKVFGPFPLEVARLSQLQYFKNLQTLHIETSGLPQDYTPKGYLQDPFTYLDSVLREWLPGMKELCIYYRESSASSGVDNVLWACWKAGGPTIGEIFINEQKERARIAAGEKTRNPPVDWTNDDAARKAALKGWIEGSL